MAKQMIKEKSTIDQIEELVERQVRDNDELLRRIVVAQNGQPTASDLAYFRGQGWDVSMRAGGDPHQKSLIREIHRMTRVVEDEMIAGKAEDRQALADELEAAKLEAETKFPAIDEQIEKLKRERFAIAAKLERIPRRMEECQAAVQRLRDALPIELRQQRDSALHELYASNEWRDVRSMKSRRDQIEKILVIPAHTEQARLHAQAVQSNGYGLLEKTEAGWQVNQTSWSNYLKDLRQELAEINERLPSMQEQAERIEEEIKQAFELYGK